MLLLMPESSGNFHTNMQKWRFPPTPHDSTRHKKKPCRGTRLGGAQRGGVCVRGGRGGGVLLKKMEKGSEGRLFPAQISGEGGIYCLYGRFTGSQRGEGGMCFFSWFIKGVGRGWAFFALQRGIPKKFLHLLLSSNRDGGWKNRYRWWEYKISAAVLTALFVCLLLFVRLS